MRLLKLLQEIYVNRHKTISATLTVFLATRNPWVMLLVMLRIRKEAVIEIKSKPRTFAVKANIRNIKVLYYLCLLRNRYGLIFRNGKLTFPPHTIRISREQKITKDELMIIYLAHRYGLLLSECDERHFLAQLRDGHKFMIRKDNRYDIEAINETFIRGVYRKFCSNLEGKTVVDIGAFIGDTPIMFSLNGAKEIYAYEPDVKAYNLATRNMKLNSISNMKLFNIGIGDRSGKLFIKVFGGRKRSLSNVVPLNEVIGNIDKVDILKMDCEGCEFPALLSLNPKTLQKIGEVIIEYHKDPLPIVKRLKECGFNVKVESPWTYADGKPVGFLYARREEF